MKHESEISENTIVFLHTNDDYRILLFLIVIERNSLTYEGHEWLRARRVCYGRSHWWVGEI